MSEVRILSPRPSQAGTIVAIPRIGRIDFCVRPCAWSVGNVVYLDDRRFAAGREDTCARGVTRAQPNREGPDPRRIERRRAGGVEREFERHPLSRWERGGIEPRPVGFDECRAAERDELYAPIKQRSREQPNAGA